MLRVHRASHLSACVLFFDSFFLGYMFFFRFIFMFLSSFFSPRFVYFRHHLFCFFLLSTAAAAAAASSSASVFGTQVGRRRWFFFLKCLLACLFAFPLRLNGSRPRFVACVMVLAYLALIRLLPRGRGCDGGGGGGLEGVLRKGTSEKRREGRSTPARPLPSPRCRAAGRPSSRGWSACESR